MARCRQFVLALIVLNTGSVVLGTVDSLSRAYAPLFRTVEYVSLSVFTVEYGLRVLVGPDADHASPLVARLDRIRQPYMVIDLLAIAPAYVGAIVGVPGLGSSSLLRVVRLFKLARYVDAVAVFRRVFRRKRSDLAVSLLGTSLLWLLAGSLMYAVERHAQPDAFSSIPRTLWWAGITITTVGYGDVYPVTPAGRVLGVVVALLGVGLAAVPASILAAGLIEDTAGDRTCPHCGREFDE